MVVEVNTVEQFIAEVQASLAAGDTLMDNAVRFRVDREAEQEECISFRVGFYLTAVVKQNDKPVYLLELSQGTGTDEGAADEGSDAAGQMRSRVERELAPAGIGIRHGRIEIF